jgi:outer membrane protein assembly factor BamA
VKFAPSNPQWVGDGVTLSVTITEGAAYQLGKVNIAGDGLPADAMLSAAKFPKGKLANWKQMQEGIWDMEKVVKRTGFFDAAVSAERSYDDAAHALDLNIRADKGPLYRFGELSLTGLDANLSARAKALWKPKAGDPYDYAYPNEFLQAFARATDLGGIRKFKAVPKAGAGEHVMDINLVFEAR